MPSRPASKCFTATGWITFSGRCARRPESRPSSTTRPARPRNAGDAFGPLPEPRLPELSQPYGILVTGVGGTGVVTIGALLGMAAHMEGKGCSILDMTGLAQKGGAVFSHVRLAQRPDDIHAVRL